MSLLYYIFHGLCHQMPARSLAAGGVTMPLCARCAGMYVAFALALPVYLVRASVRSALPGRAFIAASVVAMLVFCFDGAANFELIALFQTPDYLRVATGALVGLFLSPYLALLVARARHRDPLRPVSGWKDALLMAGAAAALAAVNVHPAPWLIVAESYLSGAGLVLFLGIAHTALIMLIFRRRIAVAAAISVFTVTAQLVILSQARTLTGL